MFLHPRPMGGMGPVRQTESAAAASNEPGLVAPSQITIFVAEIYFGQTSTSHLHRMIIPW